MKVLVIILVALVIYIYISYPTRYNSDTQILQASISTFDPSLLYEKYPLIIEDRLINPHDVRLNLLKYHYTFQQHNGAKDTPLTLRKALAKYTMIYNQTQETQQIDLVHPKHYDEFKDVFRSPHSSAYTIIDGTFVPTLSIKLHHGQSLIIPTMWMYKTPTVMWEMYFYDLSHWLIARFDRLRKPVTLVGALAVNPGLQSLTV